MMRVQPPPEDAVMAEWPDLADIAFLTSSGQKVVYRATLGGRPVALKLLPQRSPEDDEELQPVMDALLRYYEREMRVLYECASPTLACLVEWGPYIRLFDGRPYLAYLEEFIPGRPLSDMAPLALAEGLRMADDVCAALQVLHDHPNHYVHRDVKPANVVGQDAWVLIDPGIAFSAAEEDITTFGHRPPGTPGYCSPEQGDYFRRRVDLDGRSDIFSLGLTLAFGLTGQHAYTNTCRPGAFPRELQQAVNEQRWRPEFAVGLDESVAQLLKRMLGRRPHERYPSIHHVREAIAELQRRPST